MNESLEARVRTAMETELDRLSGDKVLLGATDATLEAPAVLGAIRRGLRAAATEANEWEAATDGPLAAALGRAARGFEDADADLATDADEPPAGPVLLALGSPDGDLERAGACCVGAPLVLDGLALQCVSFFVNEADATMAERCRALRDDLTGTVDAVEGPLLEACPSPNEEEAIVAGGVGAVTASYEQYVTLVEDLGLDPKPIC